mmetsp:Transcript_31781/g.69483  ORF Transcript_31781/g.69483 Transcript_31781/m.69483 type:complete len:137 (-) Transcript_31781:2030-2440(-)
MEALAAHTAPAPPEPQPTPAPTPALAPAQAPEGHRCGPRHCAGVAAAQRLDHPPPETCPTASGEEDALDPLLAGSGLATKLFLGPGLPPRCVARRGEVKGRPTPPMEDGRAPAELERPRAVERVHPGGSATHGPAC